MTVGDRAVSTTEIWTYFKCHLWIDDSGWLDDAVFQWLSSGFERSGRRWLAAPRKPDL